MTATQTQIRRDTAANLALVTPALAELAHDTTNNRLSIGDGLRAAGWQIPNFRDIQTQAFGSGVAGGTGNALTLTLFPALLAYSFGVSVEVKASAGNTGPATIDVNGLGAKNIMKMKSGVLSVLDSGDLVSGGVYRLTYDGTQFQILGLEPDVTVAGMEKLGTASGGGATYDFTGLIASGFKNYLFTFEGLKPATSGVDLVMRTSTNNGSSYDSSGYEWKHMVSDYIATTLVITNSTTATYMTIARNVHNSALYPVTGRCWLNDPLDATRWKRVRSECEWGDAGNNRMTGFSSGQRNATADIDAVRFMFDFGNISDGEITMYGLKA